MTEVLDMADLNLGSLEGSYIIVYNMADNSTMYEFYSPIFDKRYQAKKCYARINSIYDGWSLFFKLTDNVKINRDMICTSYNLHGHIVVVPNTLLVIDNLDEIIRSYKSKWEKFTWILR